MLIGWEGGGGGEEALEFYCMPYHLTCYLKLISAFHFSLTQYFPVAKTIALTLFGLGEGGSKWPPSGFLLNISKTF